VLVALLGLGFALVPLVLGETFLYWDDAQLFYPETAFLHRALRAGDFPHWWPQVSSGFPLIAEGQAAAFHPLRLLLTYALSPPAAFAIEIGLYLAVAGVATYYFLREFRLSAPACAVAGICQMFGSYSMLLVRNMVAHRSFCLLPLVMLAAERLATRPSLASGLLGSVSLGLLLLGGNITFAIVTAVGAAVYLVCRLVQASWRRDRSLRDAARRLGTGVVVWGVVVGLAIGISAIQFLPQLEHIGHSIREGGLDFEYAVRSLPASLRYLPQLVLPYAYAQGDWLSSSSSQYATINIAPSAGVYLGSTAVVLAVLAVWWRRRWPDPTWALVACLITSLGLALGTRTPLFPALWSLPGMGGLRFPSRFLVWASFCLACLAGLGLERLQARSRLRTRSLRDAVPFLVLAMGTLVLGFALWRWGEAIALGGRMAADIGTGLALSAGLLGAAIVLTAGVLLAPRQVRPLPVSIIVVFSFADLWYFRARSGYAPTTSIAAALEPSEIAQLVTADRDQFRVMSLATNEERLTNYLDDIREFLQADFCSVWGIDSADIWISLKLKRYYAVREAIVWEMLHTPDAASRLAGLVGALNIKYVTAPPDVPLIGWEEVHRSAHVTTWRNPRFLPRVFLVDSILPERIEVRPEWEDRATKRLADYRESVSRWYSRVDESQIVDNVLANPIDFRTTAIVEGMQAADFGGSAAAARVEPRFDSSDEFQVTIETTKPSFLVVSINHYPGWTATIDGKPARILRTNYVGMGLPVPAGRSEVRFRFVTPGFRLGTLATIGSVVLVLAGLVIAKVRTAPTRSPSR